MSEVLMREIREKAKTIGQAYMETQSDTYGWIKINDVKALLDGYVCVKKGSYFPREIVLDLVDSKKFVVVDREQLQKLWKERPNILKPESRGDHTWVYAYETFIEKIGQHLGVEGKKEQ